MAARYGTFSRSARNAFTSTFRSSTNGAPRYRSQSQSAHRRNFVRNEGAIFRRRLAETSIPLHSAIAGAKLVSHLSFSSRSAKSALPLGLGLFSSNGLGGGKMIMFTLRNLWNTISNGAPKGSGQGINLLGFSIAVRKMRSFRSFVVWLYKGPLCFYREILPFNNYGPQKIEVLRKKSLRGYIDILPVRLVVMP